MRKNIVFFGILLFTGIACSKPEPKTPVLAGEWIGDTILMASGIVPESVNWEDALLKIYGTMAKFNSDSTFTLSMYTDSIAEITTGRWYMPESSRLTIYTDTLMSVKSSDMFEFKIDKLTNDSLVIQALLDSLEVQAVFRKIAE